MSKQEQIREFFQKVAAKAPEAITEKERDACKRALLFLYNRQTVSEQATEATHLTNHVGFNHADAKRLSSMAKSAEKFKSVTPKMAKLIARRMVKYSGQVAEMAQG